MKPGHLCNRISFLPDQMNLSYKNISWKLIQGNTVFCQLAYTCATPSMTVDQGAAASRRPLWSWLADCRTSSLRLLATSMCSACRKWDYRPRRSPLPKCASSLPPGVVWINAYRHCTIWYADAVGAAKQQTGKTVDQPVWTSTPLEQACQRLWSWGPPALQNSLCRWLRWPASGRSLWATDVYTFIHDAD